MKACSECGRTEVKQYLYGGYWCSNCTAWYTSKQMHNLKEIEVPSRF